MDELRPTLNTFTLGEVDFQSQVPINETILWVIVAVVTLVFIILSFAIVFHLRRYIVKRIKGVYAEIVYFAVSLTLLSGMYVSLLWF